MSDEQKFDQKFVLDRFRQWHFWWLVVFSLLLTITFVYYLPTRFLNQVGMEAPHGQEKGEEHMEQGMTEEDITEHIEEHREEEMMMDDHEEDEHTEDGHEAAYFEENVVKQGLVVNLNISPVPYSVGVPLRMEFFVNQKPGSVPIPADQLQVEHEKLMHVIGVRSDMNEFFHIHPKALEFNPDVPFDFNPGLFTIDHTFTKPGLYKIWSEIKKDDINYSFGHSEVNINGSGPREEKKVSFSRNVITRNYQVSMEMSDIVVKNKEIDLSFDIHSLTGTEIEVEQYLGADMHLSIIKDDWSQFIHTHPEEVGRSHSLVPGLIKTTYAHGGVKDEPAGATDEHQTASSGDEVISFHVIFPEAGLYKAFAQFRPKGIDLPADEALFAEFWIQVEEKAPFPVSQWWGLLFISVILIAGLSWWISGYLKVRAEDIKVQNAK